ncbi:MAG: hypothetical protein QGI45_11700 [Myxococcota bacterium]|jgi:hypothetical protein|nr:hypothetical protein [Myxococcota bacterium]
MRSTLFNMTFGLMMVLGSSAQAVTIDVPAEAFAPPLALSQSEALPSAYDFYRHYDNSGGNLMSWSLVSYTQAAYANNPSPGAPAPTSEDCPGVDGLAADELPQQPQAWNATLSLPQGTVIESVTCGVESSTEVGPFLVFGRLQEDFFTTGVTTFDADAGEFNVSSYTTADISNYDIIVATDSGSHLIMETVADFSMEIGENEVFSLQARFRASTSSSIMDPYLGDVCFGDDDDCSADVTFQGCSVEVSFPTYQADYCLGQYSDSEALTCSQWDITGFGCAQWPPLPTCDAGVPVTYYFDYDQDGLGDPSVPYGPICPENIPQEMLEDEGLLLLTSEDGYSFYFVLNMDDTDPMNPANDTDNCPNGDADICGACGGSGPLTFYADLDQDGLGDPGAPSQLCPGDMDSLAEGSVSWVTNSDDVDPLCATNDSDQCGLCGGIDMCGVCGGDGSTCVTQTIELEEGWNMISFNVLPLAHNGGCDWTCGRLIADLLAGFEDKVEIVKDEDGNAWIPGYFNNLDSAERQVYFGEGYQIKVSEAFTFTVEGGAGGADRDVTLFDGWGMLGTTLSEPIAPECLSEYVAEYYPESAGLIILKDHAGHAYVPGYDFNGVGALMPGVGYLFKMDVEGGIYFDWASVRDECSISESSSSSDSFEEASTMVEGDDADKDLASREDQLEAKKKKTLSDKKVAAKKESKLKRQEARQIKTQKGLLKAEKKSKGKSDKSSALSARR